MRRVTALALLALCSACGSTVQQQGASTVSGGTASAASGGDELAAEAAADAQTAGAPGAAPTRGATTSATSVSVPRGRTAAATAAAGTRGGRVRIGVRYPSNSSGLIALAGFAGVNPGDSRAIAQVIIEDLNSRGGIAGRRVEPVYNPFDVTASTAPGGSDNEQQKACAAFTEDTTVFAVVSPIVSGSVLQTCLATRGVVFVDENWNYTDSYTAGYWTPAYPDSVRNVAALVDRLVASGFMARGAKVGAVYQDLPNRHRVLDQALRPALGRHGLNVDDTVAWTGQNSQQLAAGVLKFRSSGITHVFVLDPGGLETFAWMTEAESQAYRPKYAVDTRNYPFLQQGQSPAGQLANARGIGWVPSADVGVQPESELSAADRRCLGIAAKSGQDLGDATNVRVALAYCNTLEFLKAAAGDGSAELTLATVQRGGEALGDGFAPTGTFSTRFGAGRHDGASSARDLAFDAGCTCFRYTSPPFPLPV